MTILSKNFERAWPPRLPLATPMPSGRNSARNRDFSHSYLEQKCWQEQR